MLEYLRVAVGDPRSAKGSLVGCLYSSLFNLFIRLASSVRRSLLKRGANRPVEARALGRDGSFYEMLGKLEEADRCYREAALIWSKFDVEGARRSYLANVLNLGSVRRLRGAYDDAKEKLEHVAHESHSLGMKDLEFQALRQITRLHRDLGELDKVEEYSARMLGLLEEGEGFPPMPRFLETQWYQDPEQIWSRFGLVRRLYQPQVHRYRADLAVVLAVAAYEAEAQGLATPHEVRRHIESHRSRLEKLGVLRSEEAKEVWDQAETVLAGMQALPDWDPGSLREYGDLLVESMRALDPDDVELRVRGEAWIGRYFAEAGDLEKAEEHCSLAMRRAAKLGYESLYAEASFILALVYSKRGQASPALNRFIKAIDSIERIRRGLLPDGLKLPYLGARVRIYEDAVLVALTVSPEQAFELAERSRSRAFLDLIGDRARGLLAPPTAGEGATKLRELREATETLERQCDERCAVPWPRRGRACLKTIRKQGALVGQLRSLRREYAELHREMQLRDEEWASLFQVVPADADEVRQCLGEGGLLLEYYVTHSTVVVFSISADTGPVVATQDVSRRELETEVGPVMPGRWGDILARLRAGDPDVLQETKSILSNLYQLLIAPLEQQLDGANKLVIVPHGVLHYVPFHALHNDGRYLIDDFEVCYAPSASVLGLCHKKARQERRSCLIVADPSGDLKYSREEAKRVSECFEEAVVLPSDGEPLDVASVLQKMPDFDVLHFACHGEFRSDAPMTSFLKISSLGDPQKLTVGRLYELDLRCTLATLSACETGVSEVLPGDELIGLMRGFLYAGAPNLLVSLWKVDDKSTSDLMARFYRSYVIDGESKTASLRRSILELKAGEDTSHPYFWAPFCLVGASS